MWQNDCRLCPALFVLWLLALAAAPARAAVVPPDFRVVAQYGAGESDAKSWLVTIAGDGRVTQSVLDETPRVRRLTPPQVEGLVASVRAERFWRLRPEYPSSALDGPTLILTVTTHGRTFRVRVVSPPAAPPGDDLRRFRRVWAEVLRLVPSPNPDSPAG